MRPPFKVVIMLGCCAARALAIRLIFNLGRDQMRITVAFVAIFLAAVGSADARNKPCSGKKGGVVGCTAGGKFMCAKGTTSASKKICRR